MRNRVAGVRFADRYANGIVRLRWVVALGWIGLVVAAIVYLPLPSANGALGDLLGGKSPAVTAQKRSLNSFTLPLTTGTLLVLHNSHDLSPLTSADIALYALSYDQRLTKLTSPYPTDRVLGALPIIEPRDRTTAITYLYFAPGTSVWDQQSLAVDYAKHFRVDSQVQSYVTGLVPAEDAQSNYLLNNLLLVEVATLGLVVLIVGVTFRSVVAPVLTVCAAGLAFLADERLLGWLGQAVGVGLPGQLEPLLIALLLGVLTDYAVFFLSGFDDALAAGQDRRQAIRTAISTNTPIVLAAGLTVAGGTIALYAAPMKLFRAFGPCLAITVVVGVVTAVTFIPAMLAILGRRVFWPTHPGRSAARRKTRSPDAAPRWWLRGLTSRPTAAVAALLCVAALVVLAIPVTRMRLSLSFAGTLPESSQVRQGLAAMTTTYPRGIGVPTELLVEGRGVTTQRTGLSALQREIAAVPGVADVVGPGDDPFPAAHGVLLSADKRTARLVVIFNSDPLGDHAIAALRRLEQRGPHFVAAAHLHNVRLAYAGGTAIASEITQKTMANLRIILITAFAVEFVLLAAFLRAIVAPLYLLACSLLTIAASLGLTVLVFQRGLGTAGLTFYAPFATAVLLLALGSDYNVFGVGRIWKEAAQRPMISAIRLAVPQSTRAILTAGITLAGSFAMVALVPLRSFAELAFAMAVGLLIDTFIVRSVLTPSLLTLVGTASGWPGHRLRRRGERRGAAPVPAPPPAGGQLATGRVPPGPLEEGT